MKTIQYLLPLCLLSSMAFVQAGQDETTQASVQKQDLLGILGTLGIQKGPASITALQAPKEWTIIHFIAADNNLHDEAYLNLEQMKSIGSNEHVNILAYLDVTDPEQGKMGLDLFVEKNNIVILDTQALADSGSADTFANAVLRAIQNYPSQHLAIVLWNHGSGDLSPRDFLHRVGICFDDTCQTYLDDEKLTDAFGRILTARNGKKVDLVIFDACLMAGAGTAWLMSPFADYMVASEQTVPGDGFPYQEFLKPFAKGISDCEKLVKNTVKCYQACYAPQVPDFTCSAFRLSAMPTMAKNIDTIARLLTDAIRQQSKNSVNKLIKGARKQNICMHFDEPSYIDLAALYANLLAGVPTIELTDKKKTAALKTALKKAIQDGRKALKSLVAANACGGIFAGAGGLSIFFPETKSSDPTYGSYNTTAFGKSNYWLTFLKTYGVA